MLSVSNGPQTQNQSVAQQRARSEAGPSTGVSRNITKLKWNLVCLLPVLKIEIVSSSMILRPVQWVSNIANRYSWRQKFAIRLLLVPRPISTGVYWGVRGFLSRLWRLLTLAASVYDWKLNQSLFSFCSPLSSFYGRRKILEYVSPTKKVPRAVFSAPLSCHAICSSASRDAAKINVLISAETVFSSCQVIPQTGVDLHRLLLSGTIFIAKRG